VLLRATFGLHLPWQGVQVSLVDTSDLDQVQEALQPDTKMLYVETPANPILCISDIQALAWIAHDAGVLLVVDSTWAGPGLQRPLALGADYVIHSAKYLNGHGNALGGAMSPFNAWLIARRLVTLPLRMARHSESAGTIARFLKGHPAVSRVVYPGLESHSHHELACRQMSAFGGMPTFQLTWGLGAAITLVEKIRLFTYATSLGHARSLLFYYPTDLYVDAAPYLTNAQKARIREWMGAGIVRVSVGLEDPRDLIADLDQALRARTVKGLLGPVIYAVLKRLQ